MTTSAEEYPPQSKKQRCQDLPKKNDVAPANAKDFIFKRRGRKPKQPPTDGTPGTTGTTKTSPTTITPEYKGRIRIISDDDKGKETADNEETSAPLGTHSFFDDEEKAKIIALITEGYTPAIQQRPEGRLITMRTRDSTKGFGEFSSERWSELNAIYNENKPPDTIPPKTAVKGDFRIRSETPTPTITLSKSDLRLSDTTLQYWLWAKYRREYSGDISDFINEVIEAFFAEKGIEPVILIQQKDGGVSLA